MSPLDEAQSKIELAKKVERLFRNRDFKDVIVDLYLNDSLRSNALGLAGMPEQYRMRALEKVYARGHLDNFLGELLHDGDKALEFKAEMEAELREEENNG